ncbi:MAG: sulfite exporter TauE/SafE family protein [Rhodobacteraceae bacterium]|nr:sulfite exporter TauE/SafE family protein [Paracoccaceae bacterium]
MPEALASALALPGLWLLMLGAVAAGVVRGFAGFGTAMVFLPFAGQVLTPVEAVTVLILIDAVGPLPNVPAALRVAHRRDLARLCMGMVPAVPLGVMVLTWASPDVFRTTVSVISLVLLVMLVGGFRYRGALAPPLILTTGATGGFLGGVAGLAGPPVILLYMARVLPAEVIRANITLFLLATDFVMLAAILVAGVLMPAAIMLALVLVAPYLLSNMLGAAIFRPEAARLFRAVAYVIIAGSALSGLPVFD